MLGLKVQMPFKCRLCLSLYQVEIYPINRSSCTLDHGIRHEDVGAARTRRGWQVEVGLEQLNLNGSDGECRL